MVRGPVFLDRICFGHAQAAFMDHLYNLVLRFEDHETFVDAASFVRGTSIVESDVGTI